jgi:zinc-finger of transposase IS204/IS1001/IS1096/IS1165
MAPPPSHSQSVLPHPQLLILNGVERGEDGFILEVGSRQAPQCPHCGKLSRSFHSFSYRRLQDLPWQGLSVRLRLRARRFRCRNPSCEQKNFVERFPEVARSYARQTERLREIIRCVGFVTGGLPGSRLLARLAIGVSDDTVLRCLECRGTVDSAAWSDSSFLVGEVIVLPSLPLVFLEDWRREIRSGPHHVHSGSTDPVRPRGV